MNTREIAKTTGKDISTVQRWAKKASRIMQSIDGKMQSSTSTHPADYSFDETLAIIEAGMGKNAAAILQTYANVQGQPTTNEKVGQDYVQLSGI